jgi:hypothetical protein
MQGMKENVLCAIALTALLAALPAMAQTEPMTDDQIIELIRSDIQKDKVAIIGAAMDFSSDEAGKFWPIYHGYETELAKVGDQRVALMKDYAASFDSMTNDKAKELAEKAMNIEKQRMKLRHVCYEKIASEISPIIGARYLQVENQLNLLLDLQLAEEIPLIEKP